MGNEPQMSIPRSNFCCSLPLSLVVLLAILSGCNKEERAVAAAKPGASPATVLVAKVAQRDVPVQIRVIGTVEPFSNVIIRSRVSGELMKVHVQPGQDVKAGDLLFEIDPRPFEAALHEAQAMLDRDQALAQNAQIDADRVSDLYSKNAATREEADKAKYTAEATKATVRADQASVETANLQLAYAKIKAPITGRAGFVLADQGNVIKSDDTQLLVLNQVEPIYVAFNVPEQDLSDVRKYSQSVQPSVDVVIPPEARPTETGKLTFIDNQVDIESGTIRLRATFDNKNHTLWPGRFVQVALNLTVEKGAIVIPTRAVQAGQDGLFVFVATDKKTAERRNVKVGRSIGEESVIEGDILKPGELVVTDGQLRLTPDARIDIKQPTTAPQTAEAALQ